MGRNGSGGFGGVEVVLGLGAGLGAMVLLLKSRTASAAGSPRDPSRSSRSISEETNARFWAKTHYKPGQKLDPKDPADVAMMPVWMAIYAEVTREAAATAPSGGPTLASSSRYASWHPHFAALVGSPVDRTILHSGCSPDADGNIQCTPETMRASAEKQLQASGFWPSGKPLDLATYTLARYMHSEIGNGTPEERVAVGEAAVNQARRRKQDVNGLLLYTQPNHLYGEINVPGKGNINHRWAATSRDPGVLTTLLADLVLSGKSEDISRGADDQDGLELRKYFPVPMNRILSEATSGRYWVGPIPGVDHWRTTLFRTYGFKPESPDGRELIERARNVFGNPVYDGDIVARSMRPVWPAIGAA